MPPCRYSQRRSHPPDCGRLVTTTPLYERVRRAVRTRVEDGTYLPGFPLPSLTTLAEEFEVGRLTVQEALRPLEADGSIALVEGRGYFVAGDRVRRDLDTLGGFIRTMSDRRALPTVRVLSRSHRAAGPLHARTFGTEPDADLLRIVRLCSAAGAPFSLEEILVPADLVPRLDEMELGEFSLYDVLAYYGIRLSHARQTLDLTTLPARDARILGVDPADPVMAFACTSYDREGRVVEYTRTFTRADRAEFDMRFSRYPE